MRLKGTLIEWNDDRGFGFLEPERGGERAFCHIKRRNGLAAAGKLSLHGRHRAEDARARQRR